MLGPLDSLAPWKVHTMSEQCKPAENNLAEQELVSCAGSYPNNQGCDGGLYTSAFMYIRDKKIVTEACFPYRAVVTACTRCANPPLWSIKGYTIVGNSESAVKAYLICHGPISIATNNLGHAMTLAGWDDNSQICKDHYGIAGCWIIKNSWGAISGTYHQMYHISGYAYIPYNGHPYSDVVGGDYAPAEPYGIGKP